MGLLSQMTRYAELAITGFMPRGRLCRVVFEWAFFRLVRGILMVLELGIITGPSCDARSHVSSGCADWRFG